MDEVMRFNVGQSVSSSEGNGAIPKEFSVSLKFPVSRISATREFKLVSHMDMMWGINSWHMDNAMKRILMRPPLGTIEKYVFRSEGMTMNMGNGNNMMGNNNNNMMGGHGGMSGSNTASSHHGGGMMGMKRLLRRLSRPVSFWKRQGMGSGSMSSMGSMGSMGGNSNSMNDMMSGMMDTNNHWTHAMHMHLVVSETPSA
jgi:hypothetical protein